MTKEGLPSAFLEEMRQLLGEEYPAYEKSLEEPGYSGIRVNSAKLTAGEWDEISPFAGEPVPWAENGRYVPGDLRPARDPFYFAGLYYIQEPSAMAPAAILPVEPGDRVLDVCAAPGGKSTELGARLRGQGLLFSNDISSSRAKALLKNLELFGISNCCVSAEDPEKLAGLLPEFFDKILVDAPCSGEGMFRRDEGMVKDWEKRGPSFYSPIQRSIVLAAADMLRPGGIMVYSTCTFSRLEDEGTVEWLLAERPRMELVSISGFPGAGDGVGLTGCLRLFPHRIHGEGHFVAMLRKREAAEAGGCGAESPESGRDREEKFRRPGTGRREKLPQLEPDSQSLLEALLQVLADSLNRQNGKELFSADALKERLFFRDGSLYLLPEGFPSGLSIRFLRTGLLLGEVKRGRLEPSQPLAMALSGISAKKAAKGAFSVLDLEHGDDRAVRYLKGETISLKEEESDRKGWVLVCVEGFPLGWARGNGRTLKNKYYPGWRWQ